MKPGNLYHTRCQFPIDEICFKHFGRLGEIQDDFYSGLLRNNSLKKEKENGNKIFCNRVGDGGSPR